MDVRRRTLTTCTVEKTLADLLRFTRKLGRDLYLRGLRNALSGSQFDRRQLHAHARTFRVSNEMVRVLKVFSHDQDHSSGRASGPPLA